MSLRRVDSRFLLPRPVRRARVLGGLEDWEQGLALADIELASPAADEDVDLVVASTRAFAVAARSLPLMVILEGTDRPRLGRSGYRDQRYLPLPSERDPGLFLPFGAMSLARYGLRTMAVPSKGWKVARNEGVSALVGLGALPSRRATVRVVTRSPGIPWILAGAVEAGVPFERWLFVPGAGDPLSRAAFFLFAGRDALPSWVVKFGRVPNRPHPFDADERGLRLAGEAGAIVAGHAPRLCARYEVSGHDASVESAARGMNLTSFLHSPAPRSRKVELIRNIGCWLVQVAARTTRPAGCLSGELMRIKEEILPKMAADGAPRGLMDGLAVLPGVLVHHELGSWNIFTEGEEFQVIDWETARYPGLPLWDLVFFFEDALAQLDSGPGRRQREEHFVRLFRGELDTSRFVFDCVGEITRSRHIDPSLVGAVTTLCWCDHAVTNSGHFSEAERRDPTTSLSSLAIRLAQLWLRDPLLGKGWTVWQG